MSWAHKGDKVRFLARNGYDSELERAKAIMKPGAVLTVSAVEVRSSSSDYTFEEVTGRWNTVMFEIVPKIEVKPLEWIDVKDGKFFEADSPFGRYWHSATHWKLDNHHMIISNSPRTDAQKDYSRRAEEAHIKDQAAKNGLGENDVWMTLTEIMGDKTPFLPLWAMRELNERLNNRYFGGSLPNDAQEELERLKERLSIDPQGGDWIDVLEGRINDLEDKLEKASQSADDADRALRELVEEAYDGNGEKFVIENYTTTCADIIKKRHNKAIKPGIYAVSMKNGISFNGTIYVDAEGRNWIAAPIFSKPFLYDKEEIIAYHCIDERVTPA